MRYNTLVRRVHKTIEHYQMKQFLKKIDKKVFDVTKVNVQIIHELRKMFNSKLMKELIGDE